MSRIVEHGNTIYLCGQTCKDATQDIQEQTRTTLEKVEELLESVGSDKTKILSVTVYKLCYDYLANSSKKSKNI